MAGKLHVII